MSTIVSGFVSNVNERYSDSVKDIMNMVEF